MQNNVCNLLKAVLKKKKSPLSLYVSSQPQTCPSGTINTCSRTCLMGTSELPMSWVRGKASYL